MLEHFLLSLPYTYVTDERVWNLGGVTFASQSFACLRRSEGCVVLLTVMYCVMYCRGLIRPTCLF